MPGIANEPGRAGRSDRDSEMTTTRPDTVFAYGTSMEVHRPRACSVRKVENGYLIEFEGPYNVIADRSTTYVAYTVDEVRDKIREKME